jgi:hypothetical protein
MSSLLAGLMLYDQFFPGVGSGSEQWVHGVIKAFEKGSGMTEIPPEGREKILQNFKV